MKRVSKGAQKGRRGDAQSPRENFCTVEMAEIDAVVDHARKGRGVIVNRGRRGHEEEACN